MIHLSWTAAAIVALVFVVLEISRRNQQLARRVEDLEDEQR